ncbi:pilus assembly protein, partial [Salmonella enterica subsp. enterica]|nr:pilus assembly protein [Salmonella enterica subsp. enterica serovar Java]ECP8567990.1 pilus assembly protein [Salmonella enterica subsp. enterica serovar Java]
MLQGMRTVPAVTVMLMSLASFSAQAFCFEAAG